MMADTTMAYGRRVPNSGKTRKYPELRRLPRTSAAQYHARQTMQNATAQSSPAPKPNVQTVGRAMVLMRLVLEAGAQGLKLSEATILTGWSKSTVHRLLLELAEGGLLGRGSGKAFVLGRFAQELGFAPSPLHELRNLCVDSLSRVSRDTEGTVFLGIRSGHSSLSLDYCIGAEVRPPIVPPRGAMRPLGVGAAGLAVLSHLPDGEVNAIGEANARRLLTYGVRTRQGLAPLIRETRSAGYAKVANFVVPGVVGIGVCLSDPAGNPLVSLSVVAPIRRMTTHRETDAVHALFREVSLLRPLLLQRQDIVSVLRA